MRRTKKRKKKSSFASALLLGIIFGALLIMGQEVIYQYQLVAQYDGSGGEAYVNLVLTAPEEEPTPEPVVEEPAEETEEPAQTGVPIGYTYTEGSSAVLITIGDIELTIDFESLKAENPDFVGWIIVPGTDISEPVVLGEDNSYYLKHNISGTYSDMGAIFADYRNDFLRDENTILYGHNFHRDTDIMFSQLLRYSNQDFYNAYPSAYLLTESGGYSIDIFSAYEAETSDAIYTLTFPNNDEYTLFLDHVKTMSEIETNPEVTVDDKVITLSTCSNNNSEGRYVVVGKITPLTIQNFN